MRCSGGGWIEKANCWMKGQDSLVILRLRFSGERLRVLATPTGGGPLSPG